MKTFIAQLILGAVLLIPASAFAQTAYTEGWVNLSGSPQAYGIDDDDQVAGFFYNPDLHGFVLSNGVLGQIDQPGAYETVVSGIDSKAGIVGSYQPSSATLNMNSMVDAGRRFKEVPGSHRKEAAGINASGTIVGWDQKTGHGFIDAKGVYTEVFPSFCKTLAAPVAVYLTGVNAGGDYVGYCLDKAGLNPIGFAHVAGIYQQVAVFGSLTYPTGINDSGTIAGWFDNGSSFVHGFLLTGGTAQQFDFAGLNARQTKILAINKKGSVAGIALDDTKGQWLAFYAFAN